MLEQSSRFCEPIAMVEASSRNDLVLSGACDGSRELFVDCGSYSGAE